MFTVSWAGQEANPQRPWVPKPESDSDTFETRYFQERPYLRAEHINHIPDWTKAKVIQTDFTKDARRDIEAVYITVHGDDQLMSDLRAPLDIILLIIKYKVDLT